MGVIRKLTSVSTLGLVDLRSDKERIAKNTKGTQKAIRAQTQQQANLARLQAQANAEQAATNAAMLELARQQSGQPSAITAGVAPGWYYAPGDPAGSQRLWDGAQWTANTRP